MNASYFSDCALVLLCCTLIGCKSNYNFGHSNKLTSKVICEDRRNAIDNSLHKVKSIEFLELRKHCFTIIEDLSKNIIDEKIDISKDCVIFLVDNIYDPGTGSFVISGLLWNDSLNIRYRYDVNKKMINEIKEAKSFEKYPKQASIDILWVSFLSGVKSIDSFENMPVIGGTSGGYCVFSRINICENTIQSYAFRQY